jgi:hypothetical protein
MSVTFVFTGIGGYVSLRREYMARTFRRFAVDILTGPAGRLTAFVLDIAILGGAYLVARLTGEAWEEPWERSEDQWS